MTKVVNLVEVLLGQYLEVVITIFFKWLILLDNVWIISIFKGVSQEIS